MNILYIYNTALSFQCSGNLQLMIADMLSKSFISRNSYDFSLSEQSRHNRTLSCMRNQKIAGRDMGVKVLLVHKTLPFNVLGFIIARANLRNDPILQYSFLLQTVNLYDQTIELKFLRTHNHKNQNIRPSNKAFG